MLTFPIVHFGIAIFCTRHNVFIKDLEETRPMQKTGPMPGSDRWRELPDELLGSLVCHNTLLHKL